MKRVRAGWNPSHSSMALVETTALYKVKQSTDSEPRSLTATRFFHIKVKGIMTRARNIFWWKAVKAGTVVEVVWGVKQASVSYEGLTQSVGVEDCSCKVELLHQSLHHMPWEENVEETGTHRWLPLCSQLQQSKILHLLFHDTVHKTCFCTWKNPADKRLKIHMYDRESLVLSVCAVKWEVWISEDSQSDGSRRNDLLQLPTNIVYAADDPNPFIRHIWL